MFATVRARKKHSSFFFRFSLFGWPKAEFHATYSHTHIQATLNSRLEFATAEKKKSFPALTYLTGLLVSWELMQDNHSLFSLLLLLENKKPQKLDSNWMGKKAEAVNDSLGLYEIDVCCVLWSITFGNPHWLAQMLSQLLNSHTHT